MFHYIAGHCKNILVMHVLLAVFVRDCNLILVEKTRNLSISVAKVFWRDDWKSDLEYSTVTLPNVYWVLGTKLVLPMGDTQAME